MGIFLRFQTQDGFPWVNKSKITNENIFNEDIFEIGGNHGRIKNKKILVLVFLQICDKCFNP